MTRCRIDFHTVLRPSIAAQALATRDLISFSVDTILLPRVTSIYPLDGYIFTNDDLPRSNVTDYHLNSDEAPDSREVATISSSSVVLLTANAAI
ncbi:Hypothetical predicted protein [Octopus vulgaris]|uniref:Uncharacterized protein n=1 Tax=Octopus vulgaris TaxID=6645 RepID=A0AA36F7K7_OCTVU|nr:Hypothetical predicted protein [Octopus vulgaris]